MRILFWSEVFWPHIGGAETFAADLIEGLRRDGHDFLVVTRQDDASLPQQEQFNGTTVYRFPFYRALANRNPGQLLGIRKQLAHLQRTFAPHLVHINGFGVATLFYVETAGAHRAPVILTVHGDRYPPPARAHTLLEQLWRMADWLTAPSVATAEYARRLVPSLDIASSVIHNGVRRPPIVATPLPMKPATVLCLGRLAPEKGFDSALRSFASVVHRFPGTRLVVAGDGPERRFLEELSRQLGLAGNVRFTGWIAAEHVPELINAATLVLMPSLREGLPLVAIEAAMMARPVVATRVGGLPEIVVHRETGLVVEKAEVDGLTQAVSFLLDNPAIASQMGKAAARRAQADFSLEQCVDGYRRLYSKLTAANSYAG